jgi:flagellar hook assembly protein FlgD
VSLGYLTIRIFDLHGRLVRGLAQQMPVGQQGSLVWDGKGKNGETLPIGMYVLLAQVFDEMHQLRQELRETVVIVRK